MEYLLSRSYPLGRWLENTIIMDVQAQMRRWRFRQHQLLRRAKQHRQVKRQKALPERAELTSSGRGQGWTVHPSMLAMGVQGAPASVTTVLVMLPIRELDAVNFV